MSELSFTIIGIPDCGRYTPSEEVRGIISRARYLSGAERHYNAVRHLLDEQSVNWINVEVPLTSVFEKYRKITGEIVVFASGDPLFFGLGVTLQREFPNTHFRVIPYFNSLQQLCHRINLRYDDMKYVSLTGRPWDEFDAALINRVVKIGVLTDRKHTPEAIAERMLDYGYTQYKMYVGEHLGHPEKERISDLTLTDAASMRFEMPNCVIIEAVTSLPPKPFGIPDIEFALLDGRKRMITKAPIRLLTLRALDLMSAETFWDIGFCTGSVSIEARMQFPHVKVVSFEMRPEGEELMKINSRRFGTPGITSLIGDFIACDVSELPSPDAVFIGGHGGHLEEIMRKAFHYLKEGGRIVINSVSEESKVEFSMCAKKIGLAIISQQIVTIDSYHPITIITAVK